MVVKQFFTIALVCAFFYGCSGLVEIPDPNNEGSGYDKSIQIIGCDTLTRKVYAIWPAKDPEKIEEYVMYGDLSIYELYEDWNYTQQIDHVDTLGGILDVATHAVIGWHDANGDDENYRLMMRASWGLLTEALIKKYLK